MNKAERFPRHNVDCIDSYMQEAQAEINSLRDALAQQQECEARGSEAEAEAGVGLHQAQDNLVSECQYLAAKLQVCRTSPWWQAYNAPHQGIPSQTFSTPQQSSNPQRLISHLTHPVSKIAFSLEPAIDIIKRNAKVYRV